MKRLIILITYFCFFTSLYCTYSHAGKNSIFAGDGSGEVGFVPPPEQPKLPPPPPRTISSAETLIPGPPPPVVPQSRSEAKKPPRPPVIFTKIKTGNQKDWAATPNDVNNLLKKMQKMINANYMMEIKELGEINPDPEQNPIIFRSGHYHFKFSLRERKKLRKFMLDGGMLVLNTGLGSKPFYDSAKRELSLIFPELQLQRLSPDHPLFHSYYDIDYVKYRPGVYKSGYRGNEPWFDGITINCRTVAIISRWGMAVGWEENENPDYQAYESEYAQKLGINIFSYATAQRAWSKKASHLMKFVDNENYSTDKIAMAQVIYDGEWKTRHIGLSVLLQTFNQKTEIPVQFALKEIRLSNPKIFDIPILYISGHEHFRLKKSETAKLRQYLLNGGFLLAEACCGRKGFDLSFRTEMQRIMPEYPMKSISANNSLFVMPNHIQKLGITPALASHLKTSTITPKLMGIEVDGHYAVVYSPFGMAGGWEMTQNPYAHGYNDTASLLLGQNILMYAITQ